MSNPDFGPTMRRELHVARLEHLRAEMRRRGLPALVLLDSVSIRYATGAANMENFTTRVPSRYLVLVEPGPAVLCEYRGCEHLAIGLPTIDRVELAEGLNVVSSDDDVDGASRRFADAVAAVVRDADPSIELIGIDRLPFQAVDALRAKGLTLADADRVLVPARARKLPIEIEFMREAMRRAEASIAACADFAQASAGMSCGSFIKPRTTCGLRPNFSARRRHRSAKARSGTLSPPTTSPRQRP